MATAAAKRTFQPKHAAVAVVMMLIPLPPALLLSLTGLTGGISVVLLGSFAGLMPAIFSSLRRSVTVVAVLGVISAFAAPAAPYVIIAGLIMGVTALLYGLTSRWGVTAATSMAAISVGFTIAEPPTVIDGSSSLVNALLVGVLAATGGLWGAGVGTALSSGLPRRPHTVALSWPAVWTYASTMAIVTGIATAIVVAMGLAHGGAWLVMTLFIVVQPDPRATWRRSLDRAWGTLLGFGIALLIALVVDQEVVIAGLGVLFLVCAVYVKLDSSRTYWEFTALLTPGIVLLEGSTADLVSLDVQRLGFTIVGVLAAVALVAIYRLVASRLPHDPN